MRLTIALPREASPLPETETNAKIAQSKRGAQRVTGPMGIILLSMAAGAISYLGTLIYLLVQGHWWQAGLLCLTAVALRYAVRACREPWHRGPQ